MSLLQRLNDYIIKSIIYLYTAKLIRKHITFNFSIAKGTGTHSNTLTNLVS